MYPRQCLWLVEDRLSNAWRLEVSDWGAFVDAVGAEVVTHFARSFVHADRLSSLVSFGYQIGQAYEHESARFRRDLQTIIWFAAGTLRKLARASGDLRGALKKRGLFCESESWSHLSEVEEQWDADPQFKALRNKLAFHVDAGCVRNGVDSLRQSEANVVLIEGAGSRQNELSAHIGIVAAINGLMGGNRSEEYLQKAMQAISKKFGKPAETIQCIFMEVVDRAGLKLLRIIETKSHAPGGLD